MAKRVKPAGFVDDTAGDERFSLKLSVSVEKVQGYKDMATFHLRLMWADLSKFFDVDTRTLYGPFGDVAFSITVFASGSTNGLNVNAGERSLNRFSYTAKGLAAFERKMDRIEATRGASGSVGETIARMGEAFGVAAIDCTMVDSLATGKDRDWRSYGRHYDSPAAARDRIDYILRNWAATVAEKSEV